MRRMSLGIGIAWILALAACNNEIASERGTGEVATAPIGSPSTAQERSRRDVIQPPTEPVLPEAAFITSDENRDPFQSSLDAFRPPFPPPITRDLPIVLADRQLGELRLSGIVSAADGRPRAMLVDSDGMGWTVRRGDHVGRPEGAARGPGEAHAQIHWRVERIRPDRIIFVREDPLRPEAQTVQVLRLHPASDEPVRKETAV